MLLINNDSVQRKTATAVTVLNQWNFQLTLELDNNLLTKAISNSVWIQLKITKGPWFSIDHHQSHFVWMPSNSPLK